jgi:hypothetical protein
MAPHKNAHIGPNQVIGFIKINERCNKAGCSVRADGANVSIEAIVLFNELLMVFY